MVRISVIITAYNRKIFLLDAIRSVLNQTLDRSEYEIIVTKNFVDRDIDNFIYKNDIKNVTILNPINNNYIGEAIKACNGDVISFLDDDLFLQNKLETIKEIFNKYDNLGYFKNATYSFLNNEIPKDIPEKSKNQDMYVRHEEKKAKFNSMMTLQPDGNSSSISVRREILVNNTHLFEKIDTGIDSLLFYLALMSKYDIYISSKILTLRRHHLYNISVSLASSIDDWISRKINFLRSYIKSLTIIRKEVANESPYSEYLNFIISINRIYLAMLPYSNTRPMPLDYIYWFKLYRRNIRGLLAALITFAPTSLKRKYAMRNYLKAISNK